MQQESAEYIRDQVKELQKIADKGGHETLAQLLAMAALEAEFRVQQTEPP